jgi:spore coat polysaccharide biosynthesis protein SpsF (cytidylyltransferase family)
VKTGFIIQARTNSARFPNKIIKDFYEDKSILDIIIINLIKKFPSFPIIIATTKNPADEVIALKAVQWNICYFQGEEEDVLKRFIDAAIQYNLDGVVRVCSDNPLLDMDAMNILLEKSEESSYDYISFSVNKKPAIKTHFGFWSEFVTLNALKEIFYYTNDKVYHEHVTNYIYDNPGKFKVNWINVPEYIAQNELRFTVDTPQDFMLQQKIYKALIDNQVRFNLTDILNFVISNKAYIAVMKEQIIKNTK